MTGLRSGSPGLCAPMLSSSGLTPSVRPELSIRPDPCSVRKGMGVEQKALAIPHACRYTCQPMKSADADTAERFGRHSIGRRYSMENRKSYGQSAAYFGRSCRRALCGHGHGGVLVYGVMRIGDLRSSRAEPEHRSCHSKSSRKSRSRSSSSPRSRPGPLSSRSCPALRLSRPACKRGT